MSALTVPVFGVDVCDDCQAWTPTMLATHGQHDEDRLCTSCYRRQVLDADSPLLPHAIWEPILSVGNDPQQLTYRVECTHG